MVSVESSLLAWVAILDIVSFITLSSHSHILKSCLLPCALKFMWTPLFSYSQMPLAASSLRESFRKSCSLVKYKTFKRVGNCTTFSFQRWACIFLSLVENTFAFFAGIALSESACPVTRSSHGRLQRKAKDGWTLTSSLRSHGSLTWLDNPARSGLCSP